MELTPFLFGIYKFLQYILYPFTWISISTGILTILVFFPRSHKRIGLIRLLALSSCLVVLLLGNPLVAETLLGTIEGQAQVFDERTKKRFGAIVVLGGGVQAKGSLRPNTQLTGLSLQRTLCGITLFRQGWAPRLLLAGGDASLFKESPKEAVEMKRLATGFGIPEGDIVVESRSRNTYESAVETKGILGEERVLVVTSASHLPRALALFRKQGMEPTGYPCGYVVKNRPGDLQDMDPFDLIPTVGALSHTTRALHEFVGMVVYRAVGKL